MRNRENGMNDIQPVLSRMGRLAGRPLNGIRVLDFSHVLAGPMCTRLLADLGAQVLRIESTKRADTPWRSASDPDLKRTFAYVMVHRGKKSMTVDLNAAPGRFEVEWLSADDGSTQAGPVLKGGTPLTLHAPWKGTDTVLRLRKQK